MSSVSLREINRLALPAILAGVSEPLIGLADAAIVGRLGAVPLGAVGIASSFFLLVLWVLAQFKSAISALVSHSYGRGKPQEVSGLIPQAIAIAALAGLGLALATRPFAADIFGLYQARGELLELACEYYRVRAFGYPITLATFTIFGVFRGYQNTLWAMKISLLGGAVNIGLDAALVYGIDGWLPPLGVAGAAYATIAAQLLMLVAAIATLRARLPGSYRFVWSLHPQLGRLIAMAANLFVRTLALNLTFFLANRLATGYGEDAIAAHTIVVNLWLFSAFFIDGYANAGNALAGRIFGQGDRAELRRVGRLLVLISVGIGSGLALVYAAAYSITPGLFSPDLGVQQRFLQVYWLAILSQPINAVAFCLDGIFKGLGETRLLRNVLLSSTALAFTPALFLGDAMGLELFAVWGAFLIWMAARAGLLLLRFRSLEP